MMITENLHVRVAETCVNCQKENFRVHNGNHELEERYGYQEDMEKRQITDYNNITGVPC